MQRRSKRASQAVLHLSEADPALAALSIWCRMVDGDRHTISRQNEICIGDDFCVLPLREQVGTLGHHILHIALRHSDRMKNMRNRMLQKFDDITYNLAADAIVNEVLHQAGHAIPRPAPLLTTLLRDVLSVETDHALRQWDTDRLYVALSTLDEQGSGRKQEYVSQTAFRHDLEPSDESGDKDAGEDWQGHLTRATGMSGTTSHGIGHIIGQLADSPRSRVPWEVLLRRFLAKAISNVPRVSYRRPRNGWIAADDFARAAGRPAPVFQPGLSRDSIRNRIVVALDCSGSISDQQLRLLSAEVTGITRRTGAETHLLYFDETVYRHEVVEDGLLDLTAKEVQREGGTSFVEVLEKAASLDPSALVLLTDMDGPFGPKPSFPVIWATPAAHPPEAPYGTVLSLAS